jgi:hypothetical protein
VTSRAHDRADTNVPPETARVPRLPPTTTTPLPGSPDQVLTLQRSAGNAAVTRALGRPMLMRTPQSDAVVEAIRSAPGGEYEFKLEHKGERASWSIRFAMQSSKNVLKQKADDVGKPGPSAGDTSAQLLPTKMTYVKTAGAGASRSMAAALTKADLTIAEIVPGLTITADLKGLEAKLEKGDIDVSVFKVGVQVQGALSKDMAGTDLGNAILDTGFGELLKGGLTIKVQGRFEVGIDPSDLVRLQRMVQLNRQIAENVSESVAQRRKLDVIEIENEKIRRKLKKRDLSKQARKQLQGRAKRNADKLSKLRTGIAKNKQVMQGLKTAYGAAAKGLKSKAGRTVGLMVKKVGGALLKRLVPGLNIVFAVLDVIEVGSAIWKLITGKARIGLPTGEEGEGAEGEGAEGGETKGEAGGGHGEAGGTTGTGGEPTDAGLEHDPDLPEGELGPEISIDDALDAGGSDAKPHAAAEQVLKALAPEDGGTPMDVEQLNALIPPDLSADELLALLQQLKSKKGKLATDPLAVMEAVERAMGKVRPIEAVTTVEDAGGTETLAEPKRGDEGTGEAKAGKGEAPEKGSGKGKGGGVRDDKTGGSKTGKGKIRYVEQLEVEGASVAQVQFKVVKGVSAGTKKSKKPRNLTITFDHDGVQRTVTFLVVVKAADPEGESTKIVAENHRTWEIAGAGIHMRAGETLTMTFKK